ncbi:MAG: hypothetical protein PHO41_04045 [Eubacteriales bacterium]|nr:hypothetical protein [Eubacteriales bacterium]
MNLCITNSLSTAKSVVALGMFDGVHIGHRVLIYKARALARQNEVPLVVQTFAQHPLCLLSPDNCPSMLTTPEERAEIMERLDVDIFCPQPFTETIRDMLPEEFVGKLVRRWHPVAVVVGANYTFGKNGAGTPALLHALGHALGFETVIVPMIRLGGKAVSATEIRAMLARGNAQAALFALGMPYRRQAALDQQEGEYRKLTFVKNQKQAVAPGDYRVVIGDSQKAFPALLRIEDEQNATCRLLTHKALATEVTISFLSENELYTADEVYHF